MHICDDVVLFGPFVGEFYWEAGRFAPIISYFKHKKYKGKDIKFIVLTREDRFDLYGKNADILIPLKIEGDYINKHPDCFRLINFTTNEYYNLVNQFNQKYRRHYRIVEHIYANLTNKQYLNKNQFSRRMMLFDFNPRKQNYKLVNRHIPNDKPLVVLAPRYRKGFLRNWNRWPDFYNVLFNDKELMKNFNFVICGKKGEYIPDEKKRFYDINDIQLNKNSSLAGLTLAVLKRACLTFGSQSAIPNISLLCNVEVLEFGCQKTLHTKTYNVRNTPITFLVNKKYNIEVSEIMRNLKLLLQNKRENI